jgi:colicin import membrane protein
MARRLKAYQTSLGFFDLAIAAPSMKAAAEAWGSPINVFKQGLAKETKDPAIVAATMASPGVVLKRPVGSNIAYSRDAKLPKNLPPAEVKDRQAKYRPQSKGRPALDNGATRSAALAFERERERRERERRQEEAAREKHRKRREQAIAKAERELDQATREHYIKAKKIESDRAALERRSQAEDARWEKQREKLENALRRARDS